MEPAGKPTDVGVIWMRPDGPDRRVRGPQPTYTRAEIVAAAVDIADREGAQAVTMRKVAAAVGAGTMSLYRYVPKKQDLIDLMVDAAWAELPVPAAPSDRWREELRALAEELRATMHRHPWLSSVGLTGWAFGPGFLRYLEFALAALDGLGLAIGRMMEAVQMLVFFVEAFVANELRDAELSRQTGLSERERWMAKVPYVQEIVGSGRFPMFARLVAEGDHVDADRQFASGVDRILDGVAAAGA